MPEQPRPVGPYRCRAVSAEVLSLLVDELARRADDDGRISVDEARRLIERLKGAEDLMEPTFGQVFEGCNALMEERRHAARRRDAFSRAVIANLDPLLGPDAPEADRLPRHVIPGMISVLHHVLGEEPMAAYRAEADAVVQELRDARGGPFSWADLPAEPRIQRLVLQALVGIATAFRSFGRRKVWLTDLMDYHGRLQGAGGKEQPAFTERQFLVLMEALISPVDPDDETLRAEVGAFGSTLIWELQQNLLVMRERLEKQGAA